MAIVTFFGKPGCVGNRRQMEVLKAAGHQVVFRDLLTEPWSADGLMRFLGGLPVADWFNRSAKRVKAGEVVPDHLGADEALGVLLAEPLLIRRPLMAVGDTRVVGWEPERVSAWIGLAADGDQGTERCAHTGPAGDHHHHDHHHDHHAEGECGRSLASVRV